MLGILSDVSEYVLAHAQERSDTFTRVLQSVKSALGITDYAYAIRGAIPHSHIAFADLPEEERAEFPDPTVYRSIITNRHHSPRIIEHALRQAKRDLIRTRSEQLWRISATPGKSGKKLFEDVLRAEHVALVIGVSSLNFNSDFRL